ncbi:DNA glycosylase [Artemisia annua]|uniref:DNA glycosylase n=1 Tax=Artemisia annua TaxID=35608 RepID=A0A2U1NNZ7_ARTAN|nr:DNA glycosylase [Artemisia annua]
MNFERGFPIPYRSVVLGMPVSHENRVRHRVLADGDPKEAPRMPVLTNNEQVSCNTINPTLMGNVVVDSVNPRNPVTSNTFPAETENWQDLLGMYTGLLQEKTPDTSRILEDINKRPPPIVRNNGNQNLTTSAHSSYQNNTSSQASTSLPYFKTSDTANWNCSNLATIIGSNSGSANNGVYLSNRPPTSNLSNQEESNGMRSASWVDMLRSQQTRRATSNNLIKLGHNPKDGFPVTCQPRYNPTSPPRSAASTIIDSSPLAPITPDHQKKTMDIQWIPEKIRFLDDETSAPAKDGLEDQTASTKDAENLYSKLLQTIDDSPPSAISTTRKEHIISDDKDGQAIEMNSTPQQKTPARRRKHRPKVIREGKPKKAPTPKDPINGSSEPRVKRKYVRKNSSNEKPPVERVGKRKYVRRKGIDHLEGQQQSGVDNIPPKSCKKKLNFDLEHVPEDKNRNIISSQQDINANVNPEGTEQDKRTTGIHETSDIKIVQQNEYINGSMTTSPQQDKLENGYSNVNQTARAEDIKHNVFQGGIAPTNLQGTSSERMIILDERRGIKRQGSEHTCQNVYTLNSLAMYQKLLVGVAHRASDRNSLNSILLENHKKMRMQSQFQALEGIPRQMSSIYGNGSAMELLNSCTGRIDPSWRAINVGGNVNHPQFRPPMAATHYLQKHQVLSSPRPQIVRFIPGRSPTYPHGGLVSWNPLPPTPPQGVPKFAVTAYPTLENKQNAQPNAYNQWFNGSNEMLQQQNSTPFKGYKQSTPAPRGRPAKQKAEVSILDYITHKLEGLYICEENKKQQKELVVYRGSEALVPFEPIKKRIPRPRVDLDPETERIWGLLMGIEGSEGAETVNKDKEKWWEDERQVFRGRADSFIARMHLVQGDRRFSRWKGSVVDSVIGVFLTQNVSDHLSSSAFMSLAAKFPLKSTTTKESCCQHGACKGPIEVAANNHSRISEEEVILSQDSSASSTVQTADEVGSSSGSNSEAEDVITDYETSKLSGPPLNLIHEEETTILKDQPSMVLDEQATDTRHLPNEANSSKGIPINVADSTSVVDKRICFENTVTEANSKEQKASGEPPSGPGPNMPKVKKGTAEEERRRAIDWDSLRKEALLNSEKKERSKDAADSLDYEALRRAHVNEISDAIRERGMNNLLADRMKDFLNRLVRDHGAIDLEWLRDAPQDKVKDYLLSFRGLGLKSVECVRLLTLHHLAFPVDTNVGRIAVRLGWVPLQPLPESLQLHLLEMYPVLESIQKYLWPRLCKLDQLTLYELHYQMITFGKVFCTKSKPNCNACPMRAECRHFASAFASARLSLPGPEEKRIVTSDAPAATDPVPPVVMRPMPLPPAENDFYKSERNCEPIIEEPTTPEPDANELSISDIEDQYYEDSDEIPTIKLNMEEFTTNLQNIMQDSKELDDDMSKALVALNPNAASIPTPKLKDVSRLRTEHLVYELPDSHRLLEGLDKREPDDPSHYLLAIWTPGETANSAETPGKECPEQQSGQLCERTTCFACNSVKEANSEVVRGTILIPCRTATRGSFPLNGTYFQVNEMFADHASSLNPINVPRAWIWNLPRRTVYFGTSLKVTIKTGFARVEH